MDQKELRKIAGPVISITVMYNLGLLSIFFAVPLQLAAIRGNRKDFITVSLLSSVLILMTRFLLLNTANFPELVILDVVVVAAVSVALYFANYVLYGYSVPVRFGIITAAAGVLLLALSPFCGALEENIIFSLNKMMNLVNILPVADAGAGSVSIQGETLYLMMKDLFGRSGLALFFFFIAYSWWGSYKMSLRMGMKKEDLKNISNWDMPDSAVWLLFVPLTVLLIGRLTSQSGAILLRGIPLYFISNLLFIMTGLYGIRGIQIILKVFRKWNIPRQMNLILVLAIAMLIAVPGVNLVLLILVAGLGVSELWVNYRIFDKE
ncbi:MAG: hypothetical protein B6241_02980 [Spirochaetaceae bacterium 4572_59]|nr:MAG: hypothetical protein B6241_02980 [Spirochaetaceae bacterium 4572_59]